MSRFFGFPPSFLWGAATASHQVEGDNHWNDWWRHEQEGRLPFRSGRACGHYERFEEDFDLARSWAHNAHRFSIEWSRVEPEAGRWNDRAVEHYAAVIQALRRRDIEPVVTLHHFTNPAWFAERGGWLRRDAGRLFCSYVSRIARELPPVRYWITVNEPTVYAKKGYVDGGWPPFRRSDWLGAGRVLQRMAAAHVGAYRVLRALCGDAQVGFAHSAPFVVACGQRGWRDALAARARDLVLNDLFFRLVRAHAAWHRCGRGFDFVGLNYYTRTLVRAAPGLRGALFGTDCREPHHADLGPQNELGWEVHPQGLRGVLRRFSGYGVPIVVTENGLATRDDDARTRFIRDHVRALARALELGVDVRGYLHWTLMDNYEWASGYQAHFGLAALASGSGERQPRPSSRFFESICRRNGLDLDDESDRDAERSVDQR